MFFNCINGKCQYTMLRRLLLTTLTTCLQRKGKALPMVRFQPRPVLLHVCVFITCSAIGSSALAGPASKTVTGEKPRYLVISDMTHDDTQSLIRLLLYANDIDIEAIVVTNQRPDRDQNSTHGWEAAQRILAAYGKVEDNLRLHDPAYPSMKRLKSITVQHSGAPTISFVASSDTFWDYIGKGDNKDGKPKSTEATAILKEVFAKDDPRPLHVGLWSGAVPFSQALWEYRQEVKAAQFDALIGKLYVYDVAAQDVTNDYLVDMKSANKLFYGYGKSGFRGKRAIPAKYACFSSWGLYIRDGYIDKSRIKNAGGPLTALYGGGGEGDTPSFLHIVSSVLGLNDATDYRQASWGGSFGKMPLIGPGVYTENLAPHDALKRWIPAARNDFYERAKRAVKQPGQVNRRPNVMINGDATNRILRMRAARGSVVKLNAEGTKDADGDTLTYTWVEDPDSAGHSGPPLALSSTKGLTTSLKVPWHRVHDIHVILTVTDSGKLQSYRRVVITPTGLPKAHDGVTVAGGEVFGQGKPWGNNPKVRYASAFDGNTDTFVDLDVTEEKFVGLDLGRLPGVSLRVTQIRFHPRRGLEGRMAGGMFQGSNKSAVEGYKDLCVIKRAAAGWNTLPVKNASAYRYLRYLSPGHGNANVAEIEFLVTPVVD